MAESAVQNPAFDALGRSPEALPFWSRYGLPLRVMFPAANTKRDIPHGLGAVPTGYMVLWSDAPITAAPGVRWTSEIAYLQSTAANARAIIVFLTFRESELALMPSWDVGPSVTPPDGGGGIPALHHQTHEDGGTDEVALDASQIVSGIINSARLPATTPGLHHATHEPGGSDVLLNAAWTNQANTFTQDQTLSKAGGVVLTLMDPSQAGDFRRVEIRNQSGLLQLNALTDAGLQQGGFQVNHLGNTEVSADLQVDGHTTLLGNATVSGLLTVNGFGTHSFSASGTGSNTLSVQNPAAGAGNEAAIFLGNDASFARGRLEMFSTTYTPYTRYYPDGLLVESTGVGGLTLSAFDGSGAIRFYSGGAVLRGTVLASGYWVCGGGSSTSLYASTQTLYYNGILENGLAVGDTAAAANAGFVVFHAAGAGLIGLISRTGTTNGVTYGTTSDRRLKDDRGRAADLTALRAVIVHDFAWTVDATCDRGVFAQETHPVFPRAVTVGSEGADLSRPWMTDYSKFVPDLIVGWQQHDADIQALKALLKDR